MHRPHGELSTCCARHHYRISSTLRLVPGITSIFGHKRDRSDLPCDDGPMTASAGDDTTNNDPLPDVALTDAGASDEAARSNAARSSAAQSAGASDDNPTDVSTTNMSDDTTNDLGDTAEPADAVRAWLADKIRDRVIGPDATERTDALFDAPGPRRFDEGAPIRRVHADAAMFIGGLRALLLQSLHPLAMAGVAEHSDYRNDPWGRLQRTADFLATTSFGTIEMGDASIAAVKRIHDRVTGTAPDGRTYAANDPHLLAWVHVAEVDSFLRAFDRYGAEPIKGADRDTYVAQSGEVARALGADPVPTTEAEVADLLRSYRPELRSTPAAREAARYLLLQPPLPLSSRPAYGLLAAAASSLLPVWARRQLLIPVLPLAEHLAIRPAGAFITGTIRWALAPEQRV